MNKIEAENFIYESYVKAQKYQDYYEKDSTKRRNDLTLNLIRNKSKTPCVVITGSKGKGSVANMVSEILKIKYRVGLMTSPHIEDFCERFQVNGEKLLEEEFVKLIEKIKPEIEQIDSTLPQNVCISPMGIQTYLALNYFENKNTEFNIFECGKGAKYDDVNNVMHEYAVINSIFLEHTRELGETLEEIAEDKAHVIDGYQKCVYVAEQVPSVIKVIKDKAEKLNVSLKIYGRDFSSNNIRYTKEGMLFDVTIGQEVYSDIQIPLLGEHQTKNCALALALCHDILENKEIKENGIGEQNFIKTKQNLLSINWPGRMEIIERNPFILLDACINRESCKNVLAVLKKLNIEDINLIVGIPDDKDYEGVVEEMKIVASKVILTKSQNQHYIFTRKQKDSLETKGIITEWTESVSEAVNLAKTEDKSIVILGTTSVIAEIKKLKM